MRAVAMGCRITSGMRRRRKRNSRSLGPIAIARRWAPRLAKVVESGSEGYVVGILPAGEWANRPPGWKGQPRPGVMVNWDEATYPIDVTEEMFLEVIEGESVRGLRRLRALGRLRVVGREV